MITDVHTHFIPSFVMEEAAAPSGCLGVRADGNALVHPNGFRYPVTDDFLDPAVKLADMDDRRIDVSVLSIAPTLLHYEADADVATEFARRANDSLSELVSRSDRLFGFATLALQDGDAAAAELTRAVGELGLVGAQVGSRVAGVPLDAPALDPVYAAAAMLRVPLLIHPNALEPRPGLEDYYFANSIGHPLETTLAAARLIHSGLLARHPELRIILVHGGGFLPYQLGRFDHAHAVRTEPRRHIDDPPSTYIDRFWIDSITHSDAALAFLAASFGDRLVLGTDLPFDMADRAPVERLERVGADPHALGATAAALIPALRR